LASRPDFFTLGQPVEENLASSFPRSSEGSQGKPPGTAGTFLQTFGALFLFWNFIASLAEPCVRP
jgi:hypothetical protein